MSFKDLPVSTWPVLQLQTRSVHSFYVGARDLSSDPCAGVAGPLWTESSPWPYILLFMSLNLWSFLDSCVRRLMRPTLQLNSMNAFRISWNSDLGDDPSRFTADNSTKRSSQWPQLILSYVYPLPPLAPESLECTKKMLALSPWRFFPTVFLLPGCGQPPLGALRTYAGLGTVQRGRVGVHACQHKYRKRQRDRKLRGVQRWHLVESVIPPLQEEDSSSSPALCCMSGVLGVTLALPEAVYSPLGSPSCLSCSPAPFSSVLLPILFL